MSDSIGDQIFWARERAGMTQDELATQVGVGSRTISAYEAGKYCPRPGVIDRLSEVLKVDLTVTRRSGTEENARSSPATNRRQRRSDPSRIGTIAKSGFLTPEEIQLRIAEVRQTAQAALVGNYIRLLSHEQTGFRRGCFIYTIRIAASKPITPEEILLALRWGLGDRRHLPEAMDGDTVETLG